MLGDNGSWVLSEQLALYRTLDTWKDNRARNSVALNDAAWQSQYNDLVNRYNRLLQDANRLADVQDRILHGKDQEIADLKAESASLRIDVERFRLEALSVRAQLDLERKLDEERVLREQSKGV